MSNSKYPRETAETVDQSRCPGAQSCSYCHQPFKSRGKFLRVITQVTFMRGDDEVDFYHFGCKKRMDRNVTKAKGEQS
jgi:hypothetical protein